MASLGDIGVSAFINILSAFAFLLAFALLRIQPINDRVYFTKWYIAGKRSSPRNNWGGVVALKMSESEIITHAGLDSAVFLRIYTLGLKIFGPIAIVAFLVLLPVNASGGTLFFLRRDLVVSNIDKLSISNVRPKSYKFLAHISMEYLFTFWACYMLYKEYDRVASMRLNFLASKGRRPEQFTVLVRNVPRDSGHSVSDSVETFFRRNHPDHYLSHQPVYNTKKFAKLVRKRDRLQNWLDYNQLKFERNPNNRPTKKRGFLGLWGQRVDSIDFYKEQIKHLDKQTQQSKNPTLWLTNWAPEPRDVYWKNLAIPYVSLTIRRLVIAISVFALVFFYMIPIAFVQSLANLEGLQKEGHQVTPTGFPSGLALKIFLLALPSILMLMSKIEGHVSLAVLERKTAAKYYYFMLVNVFLGSIAAGTAFQQLHAFLHQSATQIPRNIGVSIPMKATFFITYIMVDGWAGIASEILRLKPLVIFHLKNMFIVKTERDLEKAMNAKSVDFPEALPSLQLYFLLGIVYMVTPVLLPFILVFFAFAHFVYRHQVINVYNQKYDAPARSWSHYSKLGNIAIAANGTAEHKEGCKLNSFAHHLTILTLTFHKYCKNRFEPAFRKYPLEEAMTKDTQDLAFESDVDLKSYLTDAYVHPIFHSFEEVELAEERYRITAMMFIPIDVRLLALSPDRVLAVLHFQLYGLSMDVDGDGQWVVCCFRVLEAADWLAPLLNLCVLPNYMCCRAMQNYVFSGACGCSG
ncbi:UNVERIFIED_CONTAM: CSC1-like protein [Sesamum calycinum]|uniref:CSC1-like protein n=1 Tax=Sesamum calycinum TaxID=2727403 RepID=A0AAW2QV83_9LAMI